MQYLWGFCADLSSTIKDASVKLMILGFVTACLHTGPTTHPSHGPQHCPSQGPQQHCPSQGPQQYCPSQGPQHCPSHGGCWTGYEEHCPPTSRPSEALTISLWQLFHGLESPDKQALHSLLLIRNCCLFQLGSDTWFPDIHSSV